MHRLSQSEVVTSTHPKDPPRRAFVWVDEAGDVEGVVTIGHVGNHEEEGCRIVLWRRLELPNSFGKTGDDCRDILRLETHADLVISRQLQDVPIVS